MMQTEYTYCDRVFSTVPRIGEIKAYNAGQGRTDIRFIDSTLCTVFRLPQKVSDCRIQQLQKANLDFFIGVLAEMVKESAPKAPRRKADIPIWEKSNLTLEEAASYFGVGINKLRELSNDDNCPFVLWCGSKRLIKRKALERYFEGAFSI